MECDEVVKAGITSVDPEEGPSALNSTILNYYKKFGRKRDLEQFFSLSTAQGDVRDPTGLFWRRMKSQSDSDSGERSRESSAEICRISIKCSVPEPEPSSSQEENTQTQDDKAESVSPPIITEDAEEHPHNISMYSDNVSLKSDDNISQKSIDVLLDTSLSKPLSPTGSATSQRRLEWDSLADVGYANESDRKNSATSLSTLERLALKQQYSNDSKQESKLESCLGLPTGHSTPMDNNDSKGKTGSKTTKLYRRDVDLVEVSIPEGSSVNPGQSINVNLTKHISFNVEKDGGITVDKTRKDVSVMPDKSPIEVIPELKADKEIQTSLVKDKTPKKSTSLNEVPKTLQSLYGQGIPVLINLNTFKKKPSRKKVTATKSRRNLRVKKRCEANKENLPSHEKSGEPVSEAESFEYMPGHIYNQNKMNRDQNRPNQSAGNKSSLESSGLLTTDSSKDSKKSFTKDLEKSVNVLKLALQKRYNDSDLKERLVKEVVQRLLKSTYRNEESATDFLSGLSFSSNKIGLAEDHTTTSTSDANNTREASASSRPKKSILRSNKFIPNAGASSSQSAPNLPSVSNSEKPVMPSLTKRLLTSNTESDASSKDKYSSDAAITKTSSEELYEKYLEALKKEQDYKKHLREKETFLRQKLVGSESVNFPTRLDVSSQRRIKNLMKDLTRNNYDDGSGDASKLEGGNTSSMHVRYPLGTNRNHSVFTLSSANPDKQKKSKRSEERSQKRTESPRKRDSPRAGSSKKDDETVPHRSQPPCSSKACDSSTQVNMKEKSRHASSKEEESTNKLEKGTPRGHSKGFPKFLMDPSGEIKYVCIGDETLESTSKGNDNVMIYKCARIRKPVQSHNMQTSTDAYQSTSDGAQISPVETRRPKTSIKQPLVEKESKIFSKCSQADLDTDQRNYKSGAGDVYWIHEGFRCTQTEISIDPKIPEPSLSDIKMINDKHCALLICEQYRQKSKSSISSEVSKTVSSENSNALVTATDADRNAFQDQANRRTTVKENRYENSNPIKMVNVGTNADPSKPVKISNHAILTDPISTKDYGTSINENKAIQCATQEAPIPNYAVDTLFSRQLLDREWLQPFVRRNTDPFMQVCREVRKESMHKVSTDTMTDDSQAQYVMSNTYPKTEERRVPTYCCYPAFECRTERQSETRKWFPHYGPDYDRATYHGVINMKPTETGCSCGCVESMCQGTCKENKQITEESKSYATTATDAQPVQNLDGNMCLVTDCKVCEKNCACKKQVSLTDAKCGTSDQTIDSVPPTVATEESTPLLRKSSSLQKSGKKDQSERAGDSKRKGIRTPNVQKSQEVTSCSANSLHKRRCVCAPTSKCGGYCAKTAKCMRMRPKVSVTKKSDSQITKTVKVDANTETENPPGSDSDSGKTDKKSSETSVKREKHVVIRESDSLGTSCITSTDTKKSEFCECPPSSDCLGTCGSESACATDSKILEIPPVETGFSEKGDDKTSKPAQLTSENSNEDSETISDTGASKDLIMELIQNITKRYSKKYIQKSDKKKCFKDIMVLLNHFLETEDENTDADVLAPSSGQEDDAEIKAVNEDRQSQGNKELYGKKNVNAFRCATSPAPETFPRSQASQEPSTSRSINRPKYSPSDGSPPRSPNRKPSPEPEKYRNSKYALKISDREESSVRQQKRSDSEYKNSSERPRLRSPDNANNSPQISFSPRKAPVASMRRDAPEKSRYHSPVSERSPVRRKDDQRNAGPSGCSPRTAPKSTVRENFPNNSRHSSPDSEKKYPIHPKATEKINTERPCYYSPRPVPKASTNRDSSPEQLKYRSENDRKNPSVSNSPRNRGRDVERKGSSKRNIARERSIVRGSDSEHTYDKSKYQRSVTKYHGQESKRKDSPNRSTSPNSDTDYRRPVPRNISPPQSRRGQQEPEENNPPNRNTSPRYRSRDTENKYSRSVKEESTSTYMKSTPVQDESSCRRKKEDDINLRTDKDERGHPGRDKLDKGSGEICSCRDKCGIKNCACETNSTKDKEVEYRDDRNDKEKVCTCSNNCGKKNCSCEKIKILRDVGVQQDANKRYDRYVESSDAPFSTDIPSTDSATFKVLNKIRKECEKYQQKRCKSYHNPKKRECSSSTSLSCECKRYCHCQWKSQKCKSCKKTESKKSVGYNLFIQTSDSMFSEEPILQNSGRPLLKNIILKVPRNKKLCGEQVPFKEIACTVQRQLSPRGDGRSRSVPTEATVRDFLEQNRPDFIEQCLTRQQYLKRITESGADQRATMRDLLSMHVQLDSRSTLNALSDTDLKHLAKELGIHSKKKTVPPKFMSEKEMKKHSEKIYKKLPEQQRKKEEAKKEKIRKTNMLLANIFNKNLQRKTLRGDVNISNYNTVVKI